MKKLIIIILTGLSFIILFIQCQDLVYEKKIIGNYYLIGVDNKNAITLSYAIDEEGSYISVLLPSRMSIGYNDQYIIVKASSRIKFDSNGRMLKIKDPYEYFIITRQKDKNNYDFDSVEQLLYEDYLIKIKEYGFEKEEYIIFI